MSDITPDQIAYAREQAERRRDVWRIHRALLDTTVSSTGRTITIECGSHSTKNLILDLLTGGEPSLTPATLDRPEGERE